MYNGLTLILSILMARWRTYRHDSTIASSLLLERSHSNTSESILTSPVKKPLLQAKDLRLFSWAYQRFKLRSKFLYPSFVQTLCCCRNADASQRIRFARLKLLKELDVARFINQQRETYISYLTKMTCPQQVVCQKLAQITYDPNLSSQNSSDLDNTQFAWNGTDERNLTLLFQDRHPNS